MDKTTHECPRIQSHSVTVGHKPFASALLVTSAAISTLALLFSLLAR